MSLLLLFGALACGDPTKVVLDCPENTSQAETTPVQGGRAVWCERKNHARYGPMVEFRPDGTLWKEGWYITVRKEGLFTWYHPNGMKQEVSTWKLNKLDGDRTLYDERGEVLAHEVWAAGERVSADPANEDGVAWPDGVTAPAPAR